MKPRFPLLRAVLVASTLAALVACSTGPAPAPSALATSAPAQWQAPLPHSGQLTQLKDWWRQFNDPLLVQLIDAAQAVSPTLASATSRIEQSRATRVAAGAALLPTLDANASAVRAKQDFASGIGSTDRKSVV